MRKLFNYGLIAILGVMTVLSPSCTKDLEDDVDAIKKQIETLATTATVDAKIKAVETQLTTLETSINSEIKATKEKITTIEGQIPTLATKADLAALAARVTALETWKATVITDLEAIKADLVKVSEEYKAADNVVLDKLTKVETELTDKILIIDGQINEMLGNIATMSADILKNAEAITKNTADIAKNAEAIAKNGTEIEKNAAAIAENAAAIAKNYQTYLEKMIRINGAISDLAMKDGILEKAIADAAEDAKAEYAKIRTEIATEKAALEALITGVQNELALVQGRMVTVEQDILDLKNAGIELGNRIGTVESDIAGIITKNMELATAISNETKAREEAINAINAKLDGEDGLIAKVAAIELAINKINENLTAINGKIELITGRIQAINFISDYADGKATVSSIESNSGTIGNSTPTGIFEFSNMSLRFRVYPADKAAELAKLFLTKPENFLLNLNSVLTTRAAGDAPVLNIVSITADAAKVGDIIVNARPNSIFAINAEKTFSLSLDVKTEALEGSTVVLENTSSNVVAVHNNIIPNANVDYTSDTTKVGHTIIDKAVIPINDKVRVVEIDKDFILGVFASDKFTKSFADYGFEFTTNMFKVTIFDGTNTTTYELTEAVAAAKVAGFKLDVDAKTVSIDPSAKSTMIGNTITMITCVYGKNSTGTKLHIKDSKVIVEIGSVEVPVVYEAVEYTWAQDLLAVYKTMTFDLDRIATATGLTKTELATEFTPTNMVPSTETNVNFGIYNQSGTDNFNLFARKVASWNNKEYTDVVLTKTLADKRKLVVTIKKITLKLPTISLAKAPLRWSNDLSTMLVQGKYSGAVGKRDGFKMDGDLTQCYETTPLTLPLGVRMEFDIVQVDTPTWVMNADNQNIEIAKFNPDTDGGRLKVNTFLVYTTTTGNSDPIKVTAFVGATELVNIPAAPVNPLLNIEKVGNGVVYTQSNEGKEYDLDSLISLKSLAYNTKELRQARPTTNPANNQTDYYVVFAADDNTFAASFKSYDVFGLSEGAAYTKGAIFTVGDMKYTDGTEVSETDRRSIANGFDATMLESSVLKYLYNGITVNKDVTVTINVKLYNFWGVSTGSIPVKISKTTL